MYEVVIYDASRERMFVRDEDYKAAWKRAVECVRAMCHADGVTGPRDGWYRTANRVGYQRGIFRAIDRVAQARDKKDQPPFCRVP